VDRVIIGSDVFVGAGAMILKGSTIGDGATVGAGAVVSGEVPTGAIVVGNPARVIGQAPSDARGMDHLDGQATPRRSATSTEERA
jgi:acetyltransferase-like isoleucine patch superfamily enzyme